MPVVTCPFCSKGVTLPDPWQGTGYTCPHCRNTVTTTSPTASKKTSEPLDFDTDDEADRPQSMRPSPRRISSGASGATSWLSTFTAVLAANLVTAAILMTGTYLTVNYIMNRVAEKMKEPPAMKAK